MPFIGQPLPRFEDLRLVRGAGRYTDDFAHPNQTYAAFVRSPHPHARVLNISMRAAQQASGVLAAFTGADYYSDGHTGISHAAQPTDAVRPQAPPFRYANDKRPFEQA